MQNYETKKTIEENALNESCLLAPQVFDVHMQTFIMLIFFDCFLQQYWHRIFSPNLIASFFACSVSVTLTYPVDTLKTRLQSRGAGGFRCVSFCL